VTEYAYDGNVQPALRHHAGLDYADQRYYASSYGRFNTPDPSSHSVHPKSPGRWNRYGYVGGDPVNHNDPRGLDQSGCTDPDDPDCPAEPDPCWDLSLGLFDGSFTCGAPVDEGDDGNGSSGDSSAHPQCDEQLYTRPVDGLGGAVGLIASHQYMVITDGTGHEWTIEGEPQHPAIINWRNRTVNWGKLVSSEIKDGYGAHDDPAHDQKFGNDNIIPCDEVATLVAIAVGFSTTAAYTPSGPNSNSFMSWFINQAGLGSYYPTAPPHSVGWGVPIPGN